jgi:peroxiredoxin
MDRSTTDIGGSTASIFRMAGVASAATTETISAAKQLTVSRAFTPVPAAPGLAAKAQELEASGVAKVVVVAAGPEVAAAAEDGEGDR